MTAFQIGDRVALQARIYEVRGVSPMSVTPTLVHLVDVETGEQLEIPLEKLAQPERAGKAA